MFVQQDIRRLDITMNHAMLMGIVNGTSQSGKQMHNFRSRWKLPSVRGTVNVVGECLSFDILHDHAGDTIACCCWLSSLEVVDLHDIGMVQRSHYLRLTSEPCSEIRVSMQIGMQQLDSHSTLQLCIPGLPDLGHASTPQALLQFVLS
jgi:hypothetical protein